MTTSAPAVTISTRAGVRTMSGVAQLRRVVLDCRHTSLPSFRSSATMNDPSPIS
jgi:hypothetical protein